MGNTRAHVSRKTRVTAFLFATLLALSALFAVQSIAAPSQAFAITTEKVTARPNQQGGNGVVGGAPTRITWEGTLAPDEQVSEIDFALPQGTKTQDATVKTTVLEGLNRIETDATATFENEKLTLVFDKPVAAGSLLRIQIEGVIFPAEGGELTVGGTYKDTTGAQKELETSKPIEVIAVTKVDALVSYLDQQPWVEKWNSNTFLNMFLKPQLIVTSVVSLFWGWLKALALVALGFPLAIPIGLIFSFLKMGRSKVGRFIAAIYINVIRGTPLFLQIYIAFFGLPLLGINIDNYVLGVSVLAMNSSAYLAEIFRAGIQSINKGQFEAAASLGMNRRQTMFSVIIPQTFRRVIPTMTSEFILLYKDTSLLSSVGVLELMMFSKNLTATTGNITPYVIAAAYYLIVTLPLIKLVTLLENKLADNESGKRPTKKNRKKIDDYEGMYGNGEENLEFTSSTMGSM